MPPLPTILMTLGLAGALLIGGGLVVVRRSGARPAMGRRLAGARQVAVGELLDLTPGPDLPTRPVRVSGRIRCADPIVTSDGDRLVAFHRDVEAWVPRVGWRSLERLRETRSFELWDHDGSLTVDPAACAEPLVTLPHVWLGVPDDLGEPYAPALARLRAEQGEPQRARATTRMLSIVDRLLLLATVRTDGGDGVVLAPPPGGYVITSLDLEDAMRLLGGSRRRLLLGGSAAVAIGATLLLAAIVLAGVRLAIG
jgi:hypothetical protein